MTNTISVTVATDDYNALTRASDMLHGLAVDLQKQTVGAHPADQADVVADTPDLQEQPAATLEQITAAEVQAGNLPLATVDGIDIYSDTEITLQQHGLLTPEQQETHNGRVVANPAPTPVPNAPAEPAPTAPSPAATAQPTTSAPTVPSSVDLDKDGLPWDERIHAGTKTKKADGCWKAKRGVDKDLVAQVEAELRTAMAAPVPNEPAAAAAFQPTTPTTPVAVAPTPAPTPTPAPAAAPTTAPTAAQPASTGGITTLPQLMQAATGAGKTPAEMLAAAQSVGLQSMALLGARPDLVPAVAAALGLGG